MTSTTIRKIQLTCISIFSMAGIGSLASADILTWVGSGTNGNHAIERSEPSTQLSRSENWFGEKVGATPTLNPDGSGTDAVVTFSNVGRVYATALQTRTLTLDNSAVDFDWGGNLVFEDGETHMIGKALDLTGGAVVLQDGGRVEFADNESSISLHHGSVYRMDGGEINLPGTITLGAAENRVYVDGGQMTADEIVIAGSDSDICVWNGGWLRVRSLVLQTERPHSCISGRLEVQHILAGGGNLTSYSDERVGLVAPTDISGNRETAILEIDGDISFWGGVEWQLHGTQPGLGYDQIDAKGDLTISGILDFELLPLADQLDLIYLPKTGDTFDVVVADSFTLTEVGLRLPSTTSRGELFTGHWGAIGDRQGLQLIAQYDFRQALGDFNEDQRLDIEDLELITRRRGNALEDSMYDLDQNGVVDETDRRIWLRQLKQTRFGDSNLDGEFNSMDLVGVFTTGHYEAGLPAGWADGDWNGDGVFSSGDLVLAFHDGGYERGLRETVSAVPEPSATLPLMISASLIVHPHRRKRHVAPIRVDTTRNFRLYRQLRVLLG